MRRAFGFTGFGYGAGNDVVASSPAPSTQGPNSPGTVTDLGDEFNAWSDIANIAASDDSYATVVVAPLSNSNILRAANFGFSVPGGTTILGVVVEIEAKGSAATSELVGVALAVENLGDVSDEIGVPSGLGSSSITSSDAYYTFGASNDLWGATLTPAIVNASTFAIDFHADKAGVGTSTVSVDHVRVTIHYT